MLNIPNDYPLPNLYYFSSEILLKIRQQSTKALSVLNKVGFRECHFPFLIPKSVLLYYDTLVPLKDFIKVYSGKDRRSHAYLRPDGIFSEGISLAGKIIKSYRDLPLKLFEMSPSYMRRNIRNKENIFMCPEESFSIQAGLFSEDKKGKELCQSVLFEIFKKFSIRYSIRKNRLSKTETIHYLSTFNKSEVEIAKLYDFNQEITKRANIYFFNKTGKFNFPYMYTFSLSQNIFLLKILAQERK